MYKGCPSSCCPIDDATISARTICTCCSNSSVGKPIKLPKTECLVYYEFHQ